MKRTFVHKLWAPALILSLVIIATTFTIDNANPPRPEGTGGAFPPGAAGEGPPVDRQGPVVNWDLPVENAGIFPAEERPILISALASDNLAVAQVTFSRWDPVQNVWIDILRDEAPPYQGRLDPRALNYGPNQLVVQAADASGNTSDRATIWIFRLGPFQHTFLPSVFRR
jgi:hypothetical protein